jgi:hypothetical protein
MAYPVGFRPTPSENLAIARAMKELRINRSTLLRSALRDWLVSLHRQGVVSTVPAIRA